MRSIEEVLKGRKLSAEEYRIVNHFWTEIRAIRRRQDSDQSKNRYLVGLAMSFRRMNQREIDLETLASLTGLGRSSLQKTLKTMAQDKLVRLEKDGNDRRRTLVKPTQNYVDKSLDMYEETRSLILKMADQLKAVRR
jgi:DNA-binding MarR family transcriptional regulator